MFVLLDGDAFLRWLVESVPARTPVSGVLPLSHGMCQSSVFFFFRMVPFGTDFSSFCLCAVLAVLSAVYHLGEGHDLLGGVPPICGLLANIAFDRDWLACFGFL